MCTENANFASKVEFCVAKSKQKIILRIEQRTYGSSAIMFVQITSELPYINRPLDCVSLCGDSFSVECTYTRFRNWCSSSAQTKQERTNEWKKNWNCLNKIWCVFLGADLSRHRQSLQFIISHIYHWSALQRTFFKIHFSWFQIIYCKWSSSRRRLPLSMVYSHSHHQLRTIFSAILCLCLCL